MRTPRTFYELVADGDIIIRSCQLEEEEQVLLRQHIDMVREKERGIFESFYSKWREFAIKTLSSQSSYSPLLKSKEYKNLLKEVSTIEEGDYLLYEKFINGDYFTDILINGIVLKGKNKEKEKILKETLLEVLPPNTIYDNNARHTLFIKKLLQSELSEIENISTKESNSDYFEVRVEGNNAHINIDVSNVDKYDIRVLNLTTYDTKIVVPPTIGILGKTTYNITLSSGYYVVIYTLNGNVNCKKIMVK